MHIRAEPGAARNARAFDAPGGAWQRAWIAGLLLCAAGAAGLALAWSPGDRATPDSAYYIDGARHLAAGSGFASALVPIGATAPEPIAKFGPGFPALMAPALRAGLGASESAALVLGASYVGFALACCLLLVSAAGRALWPAAVGATALVVARPGTLDALDSILSDLPGAAFSTTGVWLALRLVEQTPPSRRGAAAAGACLALAVLVRWSALLLLVALAGGLWLGLGGRLASRARLRLLGWLLLVPALSVGPWLLRNLVSSGSLVGARPLVFFDPYLLASSALQGLLTGFFQTRELLGHEGLASYGYTWLAFAAGALWLGLCLLARAWELPPVRVLGGALLGYFALVVVSASVQTVDPLFLPRFWLPAWPLLWGIVLAVLARAAAPRALRLALAAALAAPALVSLGAFGAHVARSLPEADARHVYLGPRWEEHASSLARTLDAHPSCAVVSNDPRVLVIHHSLSRVHKLPLRAEALEPLLGEDGGVCIVFFTVGSPSIEKRHERERRLLETLARQRRIRRVDADPVAEIWVSSRRRG